MATRGRKPSTEKVEVEQPKMTLEQENNLLKQQLAEILKSIDELKKTQTKTKNVEPKAVKEDEDIEIKPNKYIRVMSLQFGRLNLSTEGFGRGRLFVFNHFGEVKNIIYSDLANIIHSHQKFAEEGRFYIMDKAVIRNHGLTEFYDKFMTKEMIEKILQYNKDELTEMFSNAPKSQQENIVNILIKKIKNKEDVDLNKIDVLSRIYGENLYEKAQESIIDEE